MSSDEESSSSCSTCSGSNCCHYDDVCLNNSDVEWFNEFNNNRSNKQFFYLKLLNESQTINQNNDIIEQNFDQKTNSLLESDKTKLNTNERLRSSYTRLTSWMFDSKKTFANKKKSIRRKSLRKNANNLDVKPISDSSITPSITISSCDDTNNSLLNVIKDGNQESFMSGETDFIVMYLMPPNDSNEKDYLIYSYPKFNCEDGNNNPALLKLKGMFVTLSQVVSQLTNQFVRISTIAVNQQQNNEQLMTVAFVHELNSILVIALPQNRFNCVEVENIVDSVANTIKFLYNSLDSAFTNENNHNYITNFFHTIRYLTEQINFSRDYLFINTIQRLLIDDELSVMINDSLNEYEAMDWISDSSLSSEQDVSHVIVVGSCIIYKGFLIQSHLPTYYLKNIFSFLHIKGILSLQRRQALRLVSWFEVYPISERKNESSNYFLENEGVKYYLSIVGVEHLIHCTLIEIPFLIDESNLVKATEIIVNESIRLVKSHFTKLGFIEEIEHYFNLHEHSVDKILNKKDERKRHKSLSSLKDFLSMSLTASTSKQHIASSTNSLLSLDESSVSGGSSKLSYSSPSLQHSLISQTSSSATNVSLLTTKTNDSLYGCQHNFLSSKRYLFLPENLICYLDIEDGLQIFTGPLLQYPTDIFYQIFKKFAECCYDISAKFKFADGIEEFGKIFDIKLQSNSSSVKLKQIKSANDSYLFSVIGCLDSKNEFYACFHTNRSSIMSNDFDIKELAYKLRFKKRLL